MRAKFLILSLPFIAVAGCSGSSEPTAEGPKPGVAMPDPERRSSEPPLEAEPAEASTAAIDWSGDASTEEAIVSDEGTSTPSPPPVQAPAEFRAEDGSFVAFFPTAPETTTETLQDGGTLSVYRSAAGGIERQVNAFDLPEAMNREEAEATLQSVAASIVEAAGGETIELTTIAGDYPAVRYDYVYEAAGERFRTSGVLAVVDRRQFQASVLAGEEAWDASSAEEFLDSFRPTFRTPTLTAPQVTGASAPAGEPSVMQLLPPSATENGTPATEAAASEEVVAEKFEHELPWIDATVAFPADPEAIDDDATAETDRLFHAFAGAQSFSVTLHREQEPLPIEISREILASTAEAIAASVAGEEIVSEPVANETFADHRLSYRYAGESSGPVRVEQRLAFVDAVQVYLIVAGPASDFDEASAERFLDSLSLSTTDAVAETSETEKAESR